MRCFLTDSKGLDSIKLSERPSPTVRNDLDVLVQVKACSLNYRDLMIAKGEYGPAKDQAFIPLSDMSGVVLEIGKGVSELKKGDRVLNSPFRHYPAGKLKSSWARTFIGGMGVDGVLTEEIVYPADALIKIPSHLDFPEASTLTIAGLTAWSAVITHGKTKPGEWVLLQGTGGVSLFAAQLAHAIGAKTIMTTSSEEKAKFVKEKFGVNATVNYKEADWPQKVVDVTQGCGVDVVVDVAGGETLALSLKTCNYGARVAVIGVLSGQQTTIQIRDLLKHHVQMKGIFMESTEELRAFVKAMDALKIKPQVDKIFPFEKALEAYKYFESQKHVGKVVIEVVRS